MDTLKVTARGEREIVITRRFQAPRALVYEAMTRPELLSRWMNGPPGWSTIACENDVRVGGAFRHVWRGPDDVAIAMHGTYREVSAPERLVRTETFDTGCAPQAGEQVATLVLTEAAGGAATALEIVMHYPSKEARDAALASGMEQGMAAGYRVLDGILAT